MTGPHRISARTWMAMALLSIVAAGPAPAQSGELQGGPISLGRLDNNTAAVEASHRRSVSRARALGRVSETSRAAASVPNLEFPLRMRPHAKAFKGTGIYNYVDLDATAKIKDFSCRQRTYDGHNGIDLVPFPFWWRMMDALEAEIVAAAPGVIVDKQDGQFDRVCNFAFQPSNFVAVHQDDGLFAYYYHIKKGSVTKQPLGARVEKGDYLGLVGSSGPSFVPHLHFEIRDAAGKVIEPFAGLCGRSTTLWKHQPENTDTDVLRVATHSAKPKISAGNFCENPNPAYSDRFTPGSKLWAAAYVRDLRPDTPLTVSIIRPDGAVEATSTSGPINAVQPLSYWFENHTLPVTAPRGEWKVRAELEGKTYEHTFLVGGVAPKTTAVRALVQPQARSILAGQVAAFQVDVRNTGQETAIGCVLTPDMPMAAVWNFRLMVNGSPIGPLDAAFDLAPGEAATYQLTIRPTRKYVAYGIEIPLRIVCNNAQGPAATTGFNMLTLSFNSTATVDIVPEMTTPLPNGVLVLNGPGGIAKLDFTGRNLGAAGNLLARVRSSTPLPLKLRICRLTNANTCLILPAPSIPTSYVAGESKKFRVNAQALGDIPLNVVNNRILIEFVDLLGIVRGATSVAVRTAASAPEAASAALEPTPE